MGPIIILIIVGLILLLVELLLIPGFAITGILGIGSMAAGCYMGFTRFGNLAGIIITVACILLTASLVALVLRSSTWKKATLDTNIDAKAGEQPEEKGIKVGSKATTTTRLCPMGMARFEDGKVSEVSSVEGLVNPGTPVEVAYLHDGIIYVKKS